LSRKKKWHDDGMDGDTAAAPDGAKDEILLSSAPTAIPAESQDPSILSSFSGGFIFFFEYRVRTPTLRPPFFTVSPSHLKI